MKPMSKVIAVLRSVVHLAVLAIIISWGVTTFTLPLPGVLWAAGASLLVVLVWALFLSPRAVLRTDMLGQGLVELLLIAGAVAAMWIMRVPIALIVVFGCVAMTIGYVDILGRRGEPAPSRQ